MTVVLDSSAVLAVLLQEKGAETMVPYIGTAQISSANLAEVIARLQDRQASEEQIAGVVAEFLPRTHAMSPAQGVSAGRLRATTRHLGLSLGDRCCLALALDLNARVLTTDRAWAKLDIGVEVEVIR